MKNVLKGLWLPCLVALVCLSAGQVCAGEAGFFVTDSRDAAQRGTLKDVQVSPEGVLSLALATGELLHEKEHLIWTLAVGPDRDVYAGTAEGKVLRVRPGAVETLAELAKIGVFSMVWYKDALVVGTGPKGVIYRLKGKSKPEKFCDTKEDYIWTLVPDGRGNLLAGTGPNGKLLRIDASGKVTEVFDSPEPHILAVALDAKGRIYASTDGKGLLYRIDPDGRVQVVYDAAESEIRALTLDPDGNLYFGTAAVQSGPRRQGPRPSRAMPRPPGAGEAPNGSKTAKTTVRARPRTNNATVSATNALYRMDPDGLVLRLASLENLMVLSMAWTDQGLCFGTGNTGRLGRIGPDLELTWVKDELENQVLSLLGAPTGELLIGTGGEGRVLTFGPGRAGEGTFLSEVFDTRFVSKFGVISWQARKPVGTEIELVTRTGNVEEVDDSWSDFSKPCANPQASDVASPPARFIQYRVRMISTKPDATPEVEEVRLSYLTTNQPPRITELKVDGADKSNGKPAGGSNGNSDRAKRTIVWKAEDPNGDSMTFTVSFRAVDEKLWKVLKEDVEENRFVWDTSAVPDGLYRVRVVASDAPANAGKRAMTAEHVSSLVVVDNTVPVMKTLTVRRVGRRPFTIMTSATDAVSRLASAAYSVDAGKWKALASRDGLIDEKSESFRFEVDGLEPGEHTVTVRVTDQAGNTTAVKTVIMVK